MAKINVPKIIEAADEAAALVALQHARYFAENGNVIELMDLLCPESARSYTVTDPSGNKRRLRS